jgi:hypothetical protein
MVWVILMTFYAQSHPYLTYPEPHKRDASQQNQRCHIHVSISNAASGHRRFRSLHQLWEQLARQQAGMGLCPFSFLPTYVPSCVQSSRQARPLPPKQ